ncbi:MAG: LysM domain-containing protein [Thermodesulfovibrionales bacterium]
MRLRHVIFLAFIALVFAPQQARAENFEYEEYQVQKGDTLWDISQKELEDYFQWPLIWRENQQIPDPDLIYPGQTLRIPKRLVSPGEMTPQPVAKAAPAAPAAPSPSIKPIELVQATEAEIMVTGYIADPVPSMGEISGAPSGRQLFGGDDEVYLAGTGKVSNGDKFFVIRKGARVKHPKSGKWLGYLVSVKGVLEVTDAGKDPVEAKVVKVYDDIRTGDVLDAYAEPPAPEVRAPRKPQVEGFVVATRDFRILNGTLDVVFIDKGLADDVRAGDLLMTVEPGTDERQNGVLQVINPRQATSAAVILRNEVSVGMGDKVGGLR